MNLSVKNIAFALLGIIVFPIFFQSVHIVWHHTHHSEESTCCGHNEQCALEHHDHDGPEVQKEISHCLICEFETTAFKILTKQGIDFRTQEILYQFIETKVTAFMAPFIRRSSSRAPPSF